MNVFSKRLLFWAPRVLSIAFCGFLSLFALDVFNESYGWKQRILAFIIHLVPAAIVVVVLVIAWRWEWIGASAFFSLGFLYLIAAWRHPNWVLTISGPLFLIAALYFADWRKHAQIHHSA